MNSQQLKIISGTLGCPTIFLHTIQQLLKRAEKGCETDNGIVNSELVLVLKHLLNASLCLS
jgi:hypothetical protein